jgi:hypothetical protein
MIVRRVRGGAEGFWPAPSTISLLLLPSFASRGGRRAPLGQPRNDTHTHAPTSHAHKPTHTRTHTHRSRENRRVARTRSPTTRFPPPRAPKPSRLCPRAHVPQGHQHHVLARVPHQGRAGAAVSRTPFSRSPPAADGARARRAHRNATRSPPPPPQPPPPPPKQDTPVHDLPVQPGRSVR